MTISVLIATRNRAALLERTIAALAEQVDPGCSWEVVIVDNASTDGTRALLSRAASGTPMRCLALHEPRAGKSHALNTAVLHAAGDLFVLTDDDVIPSKDWLRAYTRAFEETGADFAAGRILPLWGAPPPQWLSPALYGVLAIPDGGDARVPLTASPADDIMPIGANMAVRRHVVDRVGGWNPRLGKLAGSLRTGEDHEFALKMFRAGFRGVYEPDAVVRHYVPGERLARAYFRQWFFENGAIEAGLEHEYPSTTRYLAGVPRYLWRQAIGDTIGALRSVLSDDLASATAARMRLVWMAGYLRGRWMPPRSVPLDKSPSGSAPALT
jgi:glucosyl-dolichyl phosphate glucuronosyltransferase